MSEEEIYNKTWFTPESWMSKAENHILSAKCLNDRYIALFREVEKSPSNSNIKKQVALLETIPFLCGIAIENAIKALIIFRNPEIKSQTELKEVRNWKSNHDILSMLEHENVEIDKNFVKRIQKALIWSGKYPLPTSKQYEHEKNTFEHKYSTEDVDSAKAIVSQIAQMIEH